MFSTDAIIFSNTFDLQLVKAADTEHMEMENQMSL
jgi:hypothetical protein